MFISLKNMMVYLKTLLNVLGTFNKSALTVESEWLNIKAG